MRDPLELVNTEDDLVVKAEPERALFVDLQTWDVELIPAIMDRLDNSAASSYLASMARMRL